ncbi:hypothetical protein L484_025892 [Morus notabilis]|uniref:Uncharacterized protein n=1 Tax=Morus notabilis TaxID=981085 RepID=W9RD77_9ROSA|nr:hypothetical protein L484_025892 [Morus notabilis]
MTPAFVSFSHIHSIINRHWSAIVPFSYKSELKMLAANSAFGLFGQTNLKRQKVGQTGSRGKSSERTVQI